MGTAKLKRSILSLKMPAHLDEKSINSGFNDLLWTGRSRPKKKATETAFMARVLPKFDSSDLIPDVVDTILNEGRFVRILERMDCFFKKHSSFGEKAN